MSKSIVNRIIASASLIAGIASVWVASIFMVTKYSLSDVSVNSMDTLSPRNTTEKSYRIHCPIDILSVTSYVKLDYIRNCQRLNFNLTGHHVISYI
jgi:hypothetical protein